MIWQNQRGARGTGGGRAGDRRPASCVQCFHPVGVLVEGGGDPTFRSHVHDGRDGRRVLFRGHRAYDRGSSAPHHPGAERMGHVWGVVGLRQQHVGARLPHDSRDRSPQDAFEAHGVDTPVQESTGFLSATRSRQQYLCRSEFSHGAVAGHSVGRPTPVTCGDLPIGALLRGHRQL